MAKTVTASFIRDILHFHYSNFGTILHGLTQLTDEQFTEPLAGSSQSIQSLITQQIEIEMTWLALLEGRTAPMLSQTDVNTVARATLYWQQVRYGLRSYVANADDGVINRRVPERREFVWEVFVHIMNEGTQRKAQLDLLMERFGVSVSKSDFLRFYRDPARRTPASLINSFRQRLQYSAA